MSANEHSTKFDSAALVWAVIPFLGVLLLDGGAVIGKYVPAWYMNWGFLGTFAGLTLMFSAAAQARKLNIAFAGAAFLAGLPGMLFFLGADQPGETLQSTVAEIYIVIPLLGFAGFYLENKSK